MRNVVMSLVLVLAFVAPVIAAETVTVSISLTDTEAAVMRLYAREQLGTSEDGKLPSDAEVAAKMVEFCQSFATRGLREVVSHQMRIRLNELGVVEQEAIIAPLVNAKVVSLKIAPAPVEDGKVLIGK